MQSKLRSENSLFKSLKMLLYVVFSVISISVPATADNRRTVLVPELNFSVVCWTNPHNDGWLNISHHASEIPSARYGLLVNLPVRPNGPLPFSEEPYEYRLLVRNFPCFYEYSSHQYRGYGSYLNTRDLQFGRVHIMGKTFPRVEADHLMIPIIRKMIDVCEQDMLDQPLMQLSENCEQKISDALVSETTSVPIYGDPSLPEKFENLIFVRGFPYLNGTPLYDDGL